MEHSRVMTASAGTRLSPHDLACAPYVPDERDAAHISDSTTSHGRSQLSQNESLHLESATINRSEGWAVAAPMCEQASASASATTLHSWIHSNEEDIPENQIISKVSG